MTKSLLFIYKTELLTQINASLSLIGGASIVLLCLSNGLELFLGCPIKFVQLSLLVILGISG